MTKPKNILVAPLNWGLGHATRCIPIINELQKNGFTPILASDGKALELLKKEFPNLKHFTLPSYHIKYAKKGVFFKLKLVLNLPKLIIAVQQEKKLINKLVAKEEITGIISDNRFGAYHNSIPSVYVTHQLNVLSGITTKLSSKLHQRIIRKFDECWIPDFKNPTNFSGKLSQLNNSDYNLKYIGILSRFKRKKTPIKYNYLVILSGPEPQRTLLEDKLLSVLKNYPKKILFIKGIIEPEQKTTITNNITCYNYMTSTELERAINESKIIIARSGYTTIMDLAKMNKKAFFIPTPGQSEQFYLAERLQEYGYVPYCKQDDFTIGELKKVDTYNGLSVTNKETLNFTELFNCFQSK
ncbi:MAG: glycosyltransferase [Kordia sp.]|nr:MAG: glycosyltransferase [Kordia sp.]